MTPYDQGYKDAVRHAYEAAGLAITIPLNEDMLFAHLREMRKYRHGYESIQHERDHARACEKKANDRQAVLAMERDEARQAYEQETLSTLEMAKRIVELEAQILGQNDLAQTRRAGD